MSWNIVASILWGGNVFFITDSNIIYRVWVGIGYEPSMEQLVNDQQGEYSWPIQELHKLKGG